MRKTLAVLSLTGLMLLTAGGGYLSHDWVSAASEDVLETRVVVYQDGCGGSEVELARAIARSQAALLVGQGKLDPRYVEDCNKYDRWVVTNSQDKTLILTTTPTGHRQFEIARQEIESPIKIIR